MSTTYATYMFTITNACIFILHIGETAEDKVNNARYIISIARKIGACVFLTHEDIIEIKSKLLVTFVASLWSTDLHRHHHL